MLSSWLAARRWVQRLVSSDLDSRSAMRGATHEHEHEHEQFHSAFPCDARARALCDRRDFVTKCGLRQIDACARCCRDVLRCNFGVVTALEVLRRQHGVLRQQLPTVRALAVAATNASISTSNAAESKSTGATGRANALVRLCVAANVLGTHAVREMVECRSVLHAHFNLLSATAIQALQHSSADLLETCQHLCDQLTLMKMRRLKYRASSVSSGMGIVGAMLVHERRQLQLLLHARDCARDLQISALRLDSLQTLLASGALPAPRKEPSVHSQPSEGGLLAEAGHTIAMLQTVCSLAGNRFVPQAHAHSMWLLSYAICRRFLIADGKHAEMCRENDCDANDFKKDASGA